MMEVLKKLMVAVVAFCVLSVSAFALEPQKNDNRNQPPPKEDKEIPKKEKEKPPPPRNDNRGNDGRKGKP